MSDITERQKAEAKALRNRHKVERKILTLAQSVSPGDALEILHSVIAQIDAEGDGPEQP